MDKTLLLECRCKQCNKLLCRGHLHGDLCVVEIKCRGCGALNTIKPSTDGHPVVAIEGAV